MLSLKKTSLSIHHRSTRVSALPKLGDFVDKRKEIDKLRWEKVKEIGTTLDHIAKSEVKQSAEILNEILPLQSVMKECVDKLKSLSMK